MYTSNDLFTKKNVTSNFNNSKINSSFDAEKKRVDLKRNNLHESTPICIRYFILSMIGQSLKMNEKRVVILGGKG